MTDAHMFTPLFHTSPLQSHNLLAYDMRGYGRSSDPTGPYSHLNDIDTVLQSCASKHVHLVACGLGGVVALEYALTRRVSSVALFCSGLPGHRWSSMDYFLDITAARRVGHLLSVGGEYLNDQQQSDVDVLKWKRAFVSNNETWGERLRAKNSVSAALVAMAKAYRGYHFLNVDPQIDGPFDAEPLAKRLNQLSVPVFVGVGENDMPDFLQIADEIWQGVQRCAYADGVVRIEHAAHFPVLERPQVVADHLVSFWAAITTD